MSRKPPQRPRDLSGMPLTTRQAEILVYLKRHIREKGRPPTMRAVCQRFGFGSINTVNCHLRALERRGVIARDPRVSCGIVVFGDSADNEPAAAPAIDIAAAQQAAADLNRWLRPRSPDVTAALSALCIALAVPTRP